ncbi:MAG: phosphoenolpyruvate carboxykinase (GTP) [Candidatus Heimdallarchaeota archaeon]|nr:phosphoenolpyruvate carboxykinase (GTP) [Candidatus Heimdallarchaeota archaeon]
MDLDPKILDEENRVKIEAINNPKAEKIIEEFVKLCKPSKVTVITDSTEDIDYIRNLALLNKEEAKLEMEGHTIHFDGYFDQARDKENTCVLLPKGKTLGKHINQKEREEGLEDIMGIFDGSMKGKECLIRFYCLGPTNSLFSIPALQLTDSAYVAHSEDLLYRSGYEEFKRLKGSPDFFYFIHSAGELTDKQVTKNVKDRRIYIDLEEDRVLSVNNQYAGNSIGLKKLALRLAVNKAVERDRDFWAEHMYIAATIPLKRDRKTYFLGAFPSACGKTSTAMIPGNQIVGDDIAYLRIIDGIPKAVNIEVGIFGIIQDVNAIDDPLIYKTLNEPMEIIFSNVLIHEGKPYWLGMGIDTPNHGVNWTSSIYGEWHEGKTDPKTGKELLLSHGNARFTVHLRDIENTDMEALEDPIGLEFHAILYGGRDSDTSVPIVEALSWNHGVFIGATLESETTFATLGAEGVRKFNPFANLDFIVVPLGNYIKHHIDFGIQCSRVPKVFGTNYFLKNSAGKYYDDKVDKKIWLLWAEGRIHGDFDAYMTPIGYIPRYEDIKDLFKHVFQSDYTKIRYENEFAIRIEKYLAKMDRVEEAYTGEASMPQEFFNELNNQKKRLLEAKAKFGANVLLPSFFEGK